MAENLQILEQNFNFGEGLDVAVNPFANKPGSCREALNCDFSTEFGTLKKRLGYLQHGDTLAATIRGIYDFKDTAGTLKKWLAVSSGKIYSDESEVWTERATGLTATAEAYFASHLDKCIMVNGVEAPQKSTDGITWAALGGSPPTAKYVVAYDNSVYLANLTTNKGRIQWSDNGTTETWTGTNIQDIATNIGVGQAITGLGVSSGALVIPKTRSFWKWDTNDLIALSTSKGCIAPRSFICFEDWALMMGHNGINASIGGRPLIEISKPIKYWIDGMADKSICVAGIDEENMIAYFYLGDTRGIVKALAIYDLDKNNWDIKPISSVPNVMAFMTTSGNVGNLYFGNTAYKTLKLNSGQTDEGNASSFKWTSPPLLGGAAHLMKDWVYWHVFMSRASKQGVDVLYSLDFGQWQALGTAKDPVTTLVFPKNTKCHSLRVQYAQKGSTEQLDIYGHIGEGSYVPNPLRSIK